MDIPLLSQLYLPFEIENAPPPTSLYTQQLLPSPNVMMTDEHMYTQYGL